MFIPKPPYNDLPHPKNVGLGTIRNHQELLMVLRIQWMLPGWAFVNPHQRCGYSDLPFARIYFFYTAGSRNGFEEMETVCRHTKKQQTISNRHFFLMEKCFEDARQDEKHVPGLLESIIQPPGLVKEELRPILFKTT